MDCVFHRTLYVSRIGQSELAADMLAAILDETLPPAVALFEVAARRPLVWEEPQKKFRDES